MSLPAEAQSSSPSISGSARTDYFQSTRTLDDEKDLIGVALQLKGSLRPTAGTVFKVEGRASNPSINGLDRSTGVLTEGYVAFQSSRWDWRVGKQIIAWGRADAINPTDVVSPRDYTVLLPFDEDQRIGSWAAMGTYAVSPETGLSFLWKTDFKPSTIILPSAERASYVFTQPERTSQLGMRLNRAGSDIDWSISIYKGLSLLPEAGPNQPTTGGALRLTYPQFTMIGADLAKNFSAFGTRLEVAYTKPSMSARPDQPGLRPSVFLVAGIDRTFYPRLNVNLQVFMRRSWELPDTIPASLEAAQQFNAATFLQQRRLVSGMTMRISNAWLHDTLEAEVFVRRYARDGDLFVQPMLRYAFSDSVRGTIGGQYYEGSGLQLGGLKRNRGLFAELRYSF